MISTSRLAPVAAAFALLCASAASNAAIIVYNSQASFLAAISAPGTDTFTGFSTTGITSSPVTRSAGSYSYRASTPGDFFGAGTTANPWLSTNTATDTITFSNFSSGVVGIGGLFFGSDIVGSFSAGNISLVAVDGSGSTSETIVGATTSSFRGFVSTGPLTSLTVKAVQPASGIFLWPTVDNLTLGASLRPTTSVPEPATLSLLAMGLGLIGLSTRGRRTP